MRVARLFLSMVRPAEAIKAYDEVYNSYSAFYWKKQKEEGYLEVAKFYIDRGNFEDAKPLIEKAEGPGEAFIALGEYAVKQKAPQAAEKAFAEAEGILEDKQKAAEKRSVEQKHSLYRHDSGELEIDRQLERDVCSLCGSKKRKQQPKQQLNMMGCRALQARPSQLSKQTN